MDNQNILRETRWGRIFLGPNPNATNKTPHNRAIALGTGEIGASDRETSMQRGSLHEISSNSQSTPAISPRSSTTPPLFVLEVKPTQITEGPAVGHSPNNPSSSPTPSTLTLSLDESKPKIDLPQSNTQKKNLSHERLNFLLFKDVVNNLAKVTSIFTLSIKMLEKNNVKLGQVDSKLTSLQASNETAGYSQERLEAQSKSIRTNSESLVISFKKLKNHLVSLIYNLQRIEKQTKKVKDDSLEFKKNNADLKRTVDEVKQVSNEMNQVKDNWDMNMQGIQRFIQVVDFLMNEIGQRQQDGNKLKEIVMELKNEMEQFKKHSLELTVNVTEMNKCVAAPEQTLKNVGKKIDDLKDDVTNKFNEQKGNEDAIKTSVNELGADVGNRFVQQNDEDETSMNFMCNMVLHLDSKVNEQQERDGRLQTEVDQLKDEINFCKTTSTKVGGILDTLFGEKLEKFTQVGNQAHQPAADQINHIPLQPSSAIEGDDDLQELDFADTNSSTVQENERHHHQRPDSSCSSISNSDSSDLYYDAENMANVSGSTDWTPSGSRITSNSSTSDSNITAGVVVPTPSIQRPRRNAVRMVRWSPATATTSKSNEERNSFHREDDKTKRVKPSQTKPRNTHGSNTQTNVEVTKKATFSSTTASPASKRKLDESDSEDSDSSADEGSDDEWKPRTVAAKKPVNKTSTKIKPRMTRRPRQQILQASTSDNNQPSMSRPQTRDCINPATALNNTRCADAGAEKGSERKFKATRKSEEQSGSSGIKRRQRFSRRN